MLPDGWVELGLSAEAAAVDAAGVDVAGDDAAGDDAAGDEDDAGTAFALPLRLDLSLLGPLS